MKSFNPALDELSRRNGGGLWMAVVLFLVLPRPAGAAEGSLQFKTQRYQETGNRITVDSHYAMAELELDAATRLRARGVLDTITGQTPTGAPAPAGSDQVPLASLEDERRAVVVDVARVFGDWTGRLEVAYSDEDDYLSRGYSGSVTRDFNQKNTQVQAGFSYIDDVIRFGGAHPKLSRDFLLGVTQLLDRNTTLTVNVAWGNSRGYLTDPYKLVLKTIELAPGLSLDLTFPENRPAERAKTIAFVQVKHMIESIRGTLDLSCRYFDDDWGIESDTLELAWLQRAGEKWIVQPYVRLYAQNAADFYIYDLNQTPIVPVANPTSAGPFYSADYRLSKLRAVTTGLKVVYTASDHWAFDATVERYDMRGRDGITPQSAYTTAHIVTLGGKWSF